MRFKKFAVLAMVLMGLLLVMGSVLAHEGREVGEYELVFGWRNEPALVGYPNGPEIYVRHHHDEEEEEASDDESAENPLEGIEVALEVEVTFGPATTTLTLRQDFRDPTHFIADLIPTRPGDYTFRVFGTIGDMAIDEVFTSADGSFSSVAPASDVTFPDSLPSYVELLERIADLEAEIERLQGE